jgi:hypothetical protein
MAVGLSKSVGSQPAGSGSGTGTTPPGGPDLEGFRRSIPTRIFDSYCDRSTWQAIVADGIGSFGLDRRTAELAVDMELENMSAANEAALLREAESMLKQFTDRDRKLDDKERSDVIQLVCRAKPGYAKGLRHEVADAFITDFCRQNAIKVKMGFFKWAVP